MRIEPEGLTEDVVEILEGAALIVEKGLHVPPDYVKAAAKVTYAYIKALDEANAEIERLENLLFETVNAVSSYDWS